ncbi:MAG TPA: cytochrome c maturation protein CcmE [Rhodanobacteraceae bacterium]|nr:cytochrome c maturation protein CcmE [Rhodanobacteraceae bacterium]
MNPVRKRRLIVISLIVLAVGVAAALTVFALQQNMTYLYSPSEVEAGKAPASAAFRLGGIVKEGSVHRVSGTLTTDFTITDRFHDMPVQYTGILPDLFREGQSVVTTGHMSGGRFTATQVLAKHDETYMPKEVADAIAKAKAAHKVPAASPPPPFTGEGRGGGESADSPHPPSGHLPPQAGEGKSAAKSQ